MNRFWFDFGSILAAEVVVGHAGWLDLAAHESPNAKLFDVPVSLKPQRSTSIDSSCIVSSFRISITKFSNEAYDPTGARSTWASSRTTWLALAGSICPRSARSGCFERALSPDLVVLPLEPARPELSGTPRASIFEPETLVFSKFLRATNVRRAKRPTSKKHRKNQYETHFGAAVHRTQID